MGKLENIIVSPQINIRQALKKMDELGEKTILAADAKNRLLGTVTDGDIRRWILKGGGLQEKISRVMNTSPIFLKEGYSNDKAKEVMAEEVIECIPVVDANKRIVSAIWWLDFFTKKFSQHKSINIPVVIMAGGEGKRLNPFTNILPKPLIPIKGKPIIELILDRFMEFGCKKFYLSLNYKAAILKAYFSDYRHNCDIQYLQEDKPLGTVGGLHLLQGKIQGSLFVTNCDILIEADYSDILKSHRDSRNDITLVVSLKHYTIPYGICDVREGGLLKKIKEKPEYDFMVNTGLYVMESKVIKDIPGDIPYDMTSLINDYIKKKKKIGVYPVSEKSWIDIGQFQELQDVLKRFEGQ